MADARKNIHRSLYKAFIQTRPKYVVKKEPILLDSTTVQLGEYKGLTLNNALFAIRLYLVCGLILDLANPLNMHKFEYREGVLLWRGSINSPH
jgi:hypothetical protein